MTPLVSEPQGDSSHRETSARLRRSCPRSDHSVVVGEHDRRRPVAHAELAEDAAHVGLHGGLGDIQRAGDLGVRRTRAISRRTSCSRSVSRSSRAASRAARSHPAIAFEHSGCDRRIEPRPTPATERTADRVLRAELSLSTNPAAPASIAPHNTSSSPNVGGEDPERIFDAAQERCCRDPVEGRHPDVHQNDVRVEGGMLHRLSPVGALRDDFETVRGERIRARPARMMAWSSTRATRIMP